ncbi:MAG: hypothetical protein A2X81_10475 [Desulfobacterales bacterium GWB2_56_26]|nr:MAG: hypothetical protein A2X81_10475 [Desulfobacterales bacterium GWB2_56_26]HBG18769.1 hypothetical protein [Desulfobulbaceae bacterium]
MSMQSKLKVRGIFMVVSFFALLGIIFSPVFPGKMNGLDYMDNLFNMISKGSSYFIPQSLVESEKFADKALETKIKLANEKEAAEIAKLFAASGAQVDVAGVELNIKGNVGQIMKTALEDADMLFNNNGKPLVDKYGYDEKRVIFNWWTACSKISKYLTAEKRFDGAKLFENIKKKALEPAFNYYGVNIENWKANIVLVLASLAFYVIYTLWYGFGLMFVFEGLGYKIGH